MQFVTVSVCDNGRRFVGTGFTAKAINTEAVNMNIFHAFF
jgi:hypothetical protein